MDSYQQLRMLLDDEFEEDDTICPECEEHLFECNCDDIDIPF